MSWSSVFKNVFFFISVLDPIRYRQLNSHNYHPDSTTDEPNKYYYKYTTTTENPKPYYPEPTKETTKQPHYNYPEPTKYTTEPPHQYYLQPTKYTTKKPHQTHSQPTKYTTKPSFDPHGKGPQCIEVSSYTYAEWEIIPKKCCKTEFPKDTKQRWKNVSWYHFSICISLAPLFL